MLSTVMGFAVAFFVSATVWFTLGAGVYQMVRDGLARMRPAAGRQGPVVRESFSQRAA